MKVNGTRIQDMDLVYSKIQIQRMVINMLAILRIMKLRDLESMSGGVVMFL